MIGGFRRFADRTTIFRPSPSQQRGWDTRMAVFAAVAHRESAFLVGFVSTPSS